jgi:glycolate oxidase FAD binding subunit
MNKLYVGSYGTLAVITELTVKLRPVPESDRTALVTSTEGKPLRELGQNLLASEAQPASLFYTKGMTFNVPEAEGRSALIVRFLDNEQAALQQMNLLSQLVGSRSVAITLDATEAGQVWRSIADCDLLSASSLKLSIPLSKTDHFIDEVLSESGGVIAADLGTGIIRAGFDADDRNIIEIIRRLRREAIAAGGSLFVERAATAVRREADAWGEAGATGAIMRAIKDRFDPKTLLNPGRFISGI